MVLPELLYTGCNLKMESECGMFLKHLYLLIIYSVPMETVRLFLATVKITFRIIMKFKKIVSELELNQCICRSSPVYLLSESFD